jgi:hypothetical protein
MLRDTIIRQYAAQFVRYEPETGNFYWLVSRGRGVKIGDRAGHFNGNGYWMLNFKMVKVLAHRVAWFLHYGDLPECQIDHINRDRSDNRICNLRLALNNDSDNRQNQKTRADNTSGVPGVVWSKRKNKWFVRIHSGGKQICLGYFESFEDAVAARKAGEQKYFVFVHG